MKDVLVAEAGGACALCGYDRYNGALQFHHLDPAEKRFHLGESGLTRALEKLKEEAKDACYCAPTATRKSRPGSRVSIVSE